MSTASAAAQDAEKAIAPFVSWGTFLRDNGYPVTGSDMERALRLSGGELDIGETDDVISLSRLCFAKTKEQSEKIPEAFQIFLRNRNKGKAKEEYKKQQKDTDREWQEQNLELSKKLEEIARQHESAKKEAEKQQEGDDEIRTGLTKKDMSYLEKLKADKKRSAALKRLYPKEKKEVLEKMMTGPMSASKRQYEAFMMETTKVLTKQMASGKMTYAEDLSTLFNIAKKLASSVEKKQTAKDARVRKAEMPYVKQEQEIRKQIEEARKEHDRIQAKITQSLRELEQSTEKVDISSAYGLTLKGQAISHRSDFHGKNAVIQYDEDPQLDDRKISSLSIEERRKIYRYIRKNVIRFKTRMTRNIRSEARRKIEVGETVKNACRTGGIPLQLCYEKPKRTKTDLICVLDVSGSCKSASTMMLTLIGILKSVFPRGCKAFCFVNSLYDITDAFKARDIEDAVGSALRNVPTRGVYSDYGVPLKSFWEDHKREITKDTIVLWIGDFRNNNRGSGARYMKAVSRKSKRLLLLNTERAEEWDTADSIASEYAHYGKMYETVSVGEVLRFISDLK